MTSLKTLLLLSLICVALTDKWAILIAGSNTWFNYRHQADVFHAYQALIQKGFDADKIITFAFDDIANASQNPFKGKIFNKPTYANAGVDVYAGVKIDYSGIHVTPEIFLSVLEGNKTAVVGKGSEKVLESTGDDNVFMFFSDHGSPGLIAFPSKYLYADQLLASFAKIKGQYSKFVFYLESCESGSMFVKLPKDTNIYALSAANPTESSWGCYCSPDDVVQGKHIGTCLGDLFSVKFIEETENNSDLSKLTLDTQFQQIRAATTLSHVMQWGDLSYTNDTVDQFIGPARKAQSNLVKMKAKVYNIEQQLERKSNFDSRQNKIRVLVDVYRRERTEEAKLAMFEEFASMKKLEKSFGHLANQLKLNGSYSARDINFECMRSTIDFYELKCGKFSDYGLMYIKYLAEACETNGFEQIKENIQC